MSFLNPITHNVAFFSKVHFLLFHGAKNDLESVQQVIEDRDLPLFPLGSLEAFRMYEAHLLEDSRLSRLSSSYRVLC